MPAIAKRGGTSTVGHARSTTRKAAEDPGHAVRVWGEVSITVAVTDSPPQFVKVTFGHERISPTDKLDDINRTERLIHEFNERKVSQRAEQYKRLVRAANT